MKYILIPIILMSSTVIAHGGTGPGNVPQIMIPMDVPEISVLAGFAAIGVVGAVAALVWERRRK